MAVTKIPGNAVYQVKAIRPESNNHRFRIDCLSGPYLPAYDDYKLWRCPGAENKWGRITDSANINNADSLTTYNNKYLTIQFLSEV